MSARTPPPGYPAGKNFTVESRATRRSDLLQRSYGEFRVSRRHSASEQSAGKYFNINANYTLSHTLDDGAFARSSASGKAFFDEDWNGPRPTRMPANDWFGLLVSGPSTGLLRNFLLSNIVTLQSPRPFTLFVGFDANNDLIPAARSLGNLSRNTYKGDNPQTWDIRLARTMHFPQEVAARIRRRCFQSDESCKRG